MPPKKRPLKTLERVLSKAGVGSRVEARSWVHAGRVRVNGKVTRNPDLWIDLQRDRVRFDDKPLVARERVYLLLYKPTGYLTTYKDPAGRPASAGQVAAELGALGRILPAETPVVLEVVAQPARLQAIILTAGQEGAGA